jgi:hypothetical protein
MLLYFLTFTFAFISSRSPSLFLILLYLFLAKYCLLFVRFILLVFVLLFLPLFFHRSSLLNRCLFFFLACISFLGLRPLSIFLFLQSFILFLSI